MAQLPPPPPEAIPFLEHPDDLSTAVGRENDRRRRGRLLAYLNPFFFGKIGPRFTTGAQLTKFCTPLDLARGVVGSPHLVGSGTLTVTDGTSFGEPTLNHPIRVTAVRKADNMRATFTATGRSNNTLTVIPADGYDDIFLAVGDVVGSYITAGTFADIHAAILGIEAALVGLPATVSELFNPDGSWAPPTLADTAALPNSLYFSETLNALAYKDADGVARPLTAGA